jgi:Rrf2 family protein
MLTMKTKYALRALAVLANAADGGPVLIGDIAAQEAIPLKFLQLILRELRQHGLLRSRKGRGGGYSLAKPAADISIAALLRIVDGPIAPVPCLSKTRYARCEGCKTEDSCGIRLMLMSVHEGTVRMLERMTLADLASLTRQAELGAAPPLAYSI